MLEQNETQIEKDQEMFKRARKGHERALAKEGREATQKDETAMAARRMEKIHDLYKRIKKELEARNRIHILVDLEDGKAVVVEIQEEKDTLKIEVLSKEDKEKYDIHLKRNERSQWTAQAWNWIQEEGKTETIVRHSKGRSQKDEDYVFVASEIAAQDYDERQRRPIRILLEEIERLLETYLQRKDLVDKQRAKVAA